MDGEPIGGIAGRRSAVAIAVSLGVVLLVAAAVVLVTGNTGVAGEAVAAPVSERPQAGDCLLDDPIGVVYGSPGGSSELPALRTAACDGARYGEVVTIGAGTDQDTAADDGTQDQCWSAAYGYLGVPDPVTTDLDRVPVADVWPLLIGPDDRQRAAGQVWSACVVHLAPSKSDDGVTIDHSLRGAWARPEDAHLFSMCLVDGDSQDPINCAWSHGAEQISYAWGDSTQTPETATAACRADAVEALGSPAALDRGDLAVSVVASRYDDDGELITGPEAASADGDYFLDCLLVPARAGQELVGPLRGLGEQSTPLR